MGVSRTAAGAKAVAFGPVQKHTVAANEVVRRLFQSVDPAAQLGDLVAAKNLVDCAVREIADDVSSS